MSAAVQRLSAISLILFVSGGGSAASVSDRSPKKTPAPASADLPRNSLRVQRSDLWLLTITSLSQFSIVGPLLFTSYFSLLTPASSLLTPDPFTPYPSRSSAA